MVIVPFDYPEQKLLESCSTMLKSYLYKEVMKTPKGDPMPVFVKTSYEKGALVMVCLDEFTRTWLETKVQQVSEKLNIHVKVRPYRDFIKEHKAVFMVSKETKSMMGTDDPREIISLMGIQNPKVNADDIRIISVQNDIKGLTFVVSLDGETLKGIREMNYKVSLGLEKVSIRVPGVRRANVNAEGDTDPSTL
uniref:DUF4780 domain-containing protein n=1 Tax=Cacopsylla melanoneura TaxID=428564 RepID=A0A8D8LBI1_9HEMI